jgi:hypothetical protein
MKEISKFRHQSDEESPFVAFHVCKITADYYVEIRQSVVVESSYALDDVVPCDFDLEFVSGVFAVELTQLLEEMLLLVLKRLATT